MSVHALLLAVILTISLPYSNASFAHASHCEDSHLGEHMKQMKTELKALKAAIVLEKWESITSHRKTLSSLVAQAENEEPLILHDIYDQDEKEKKHNAYKREIQVLADYLVNLEQAVLNKDISKTKALFDKIAKHSKRSHKQFRKDCK